MQYVHGNQQFDFEIKSADQHGIDIRDVYNFHSAAMFSFNHTHRSARTFGGDLTAFFVYSAFVVGCAADSLRILHREGSIDTFATTRLSANSIAEMTGIPRETVRRKCRELMEAGLLKNGANSQFDCVLEPNAVNVLINPYLSLSKLLR